MKRFKSICMILGVSLLLSGCQGLKTKAATSSKINTEKREESVQQMTENTQKVRQNPDLVGEISEMVGNEMTLKIVNMPAMPEARQISDESNAQSTTEVQDEEKKQPKAIIGAADSGLPGGFPVGGGPGGFTGNAGQREGGRQIAGNRSGAAGAQTGLKLDYTGEEETITIPVGMPILGSRGQGDITFESLQEGNVLLVWLNDSKEVEQVSLMGGGVR